MARLNDCLRGLDEGEMDGKKRKKREKEKGNTTTCVDRADGGRRRALREAIAFVLAKDSSSNTQCLKL
jgi:hypothetical protein